MPPLHDLSRREFLSLAAAATEGAVLPRWLAQAVEFLAPDVAKAANSRKLFPDIEEHNLDQDEPIVDRIYQDLFSDTLCPERYAKEVIAELSVFANLFSDGTQDAFSHVAYEFFQQLKQHSEATGVPFEMTLNVLRIAYTNSSSPTANGTRTVIPVVNRDIAISEYQVYSFLARSRLSLDVHNLFLAFISGYYRSRPDALKLQAPFFIPIQGDPCRLHEELPISPWEASRWFNPTLFIADLETDVYAAGIEMYPELFHRDYPEVLKASSPVRHARGKFEATRKSLEVVVDDYLEQYHGKTYAALMDSDSSPFWEEVGLGDPPDPFNLVNFTVYWQKFARLGLLRQEFLTYADSPEYAFDPTASEAGRELARLWDLGPEFIELQPERFASILRKDQGYRAAKSLTIRHFQKDIWELLPEDMTQDQRMQAVAKAFLKDQILNPNLLPALLARANDDPSEVRSLRSICEAKRLFDRHGIALKERVVELFRALARHEHELAFQTRANVAATAAFLKTVEDTWGTMDLNRENSYQEAMVLALYTLGVMLIREMPSTLIVSRGSVFARDVFVDAMYDPSVVLRGVKELIERYYELKWRRLADLEDIKEPTGNMVINVNDTGPYPYPQRLFDDRKELSFFICSFLESDVLAVLPLYPPADDPFTEVDGLQVPSSWWPDIRLFYGTHIDEAPGDFVAISGAQHYAELYIRACLAQEIINANYRGRSPDTNTLSSL